MVEGVPKPTVSWFKDEIQLDKDNQYTIVESGDIYSLVIPSTGLENMGNYKALAENVAGTTSSSANLQVTNIPVFFVALPNNASAIQHKPFLLEVEVKGLPLPTIKLYKDGIEMKTREGWTIDSNEGKHTIVLENPKQNDEGIYTCIASNMAGKAETQCTLDVLTSPIFENGLDDLTVRHNDDIVLKVDVQGNPSPTVVWKVNGDCIEKFANFELQTVGPSNLLTIKKIEVEQGGTYEVIASNDAGSSSINGRIFVEGEHAKDFGRALHNILLSFNMGEICLELSHFIKKQNSIPIGFQYV